MGDDHSDVTPNKLGGKLSSEIASADNSQAALLLSNKRKFRRVRDFRLPGRTLGASRGYHIQRRQRLCITTNLARQCLRWVDAVDVDPKCALNRWPTAASSAAKSAYFADSAGCPQVGQLSRDTH
jgi:hypothetical protein